MTRTRSAALLGAPLLGLALALAALCDLVVGWTARDVQRHYSPFGEVPDPRILTVTLMLSAALFAALMFVAWRAFRGGHRGRALVLTLVAVVVWGGAGLLGATAYEFDGYVLLPVWRAIAWVLPVAAGVSSVLLATTPGASAQPR